MRHGHLTRGAIEVRFGSAGNVWTCDSCVILAEAADTGALEPFHAFEATMGRRWRRVIVLRPAVLDNPAGEDWMRTAVRTRLAPGGEVVGA